MPIGVPRIIYCWGEELPAQWTDIYNFIFRRRMVFLMQYLDDELCNQICGLLINIHMEDRSKELEKKEMERSGVFKSGQISKQPKSETTEKKETPKMKSSTSFYTKSSKQRSMEDLLNADEDLGIEDIDTLEQLTLQKITTEWLNWNAQFFDYSDEPYLFYLAELLSKDFNNKEIRSPLNSFSTTSSLNNKKIAQLLQMLKNISVNMKAYDYKKGSLIKGGPFYKWTGPFGPQSPTQRVGQAARDLLPGVQGSKAPLRVSNRGLGAGAEPADGQFRKTGVRGAILPTPLLVGPLAPKPPGQSPGGSGEREDPKTNTNLPYQFNVYSPFRTHANFWRKIRRDGQWSPAPNPLGFAQAPEGGRRGGFGAGGEQCSTNDFSLKEKLLKMFQEYQTKSLKGFQLEKVIYKLLSDLSKKDFTEKFISSERTRGSLSPWAPLKSPKSAERREQSSLGAPSKPHLWPVGSFAPGGGAELPLNTLASPSESFAPINPDSLLSPPRSPFGGAKPGVRGALLPTPEGGGPGQSPKGSKLSAEKTLSQRNLRKEYNFESNLLALSSSQHSEGILEKESFSNLQASWETSLNNNKGFVLSSKTSYRALDETPFKYLTNPSNMLSGNSLNSQRRELLDGSLPRRGAPFGNNKNESYNEFRSYYRKQTERALIEEESKKVFVIINSFGGSVGNGVTVHDALQFIKAGSLTLGLGVAASAASLALAGGTIGERYVTEGCHVMIHQPEGSLQGQASDIWIDSQEIMKIRLDVAEIYSLSTYRPRHKILRDLDRDFYLTASETIHYGLADEIATNEVMHEIIEMTSKVWDYHDSKQQRLLESRESASSGLDTQTQN